MAIVDHVERAVEPPRLSIGSASSARIGLLLLAAGLALFLSAASTDDPSAAPDLPPGSRTDLDLYADIVRRVSLGESYYDAAHQELLNNGYPTRSVFNWRPPFYAWFLASEFGSTCGHALLVGSLAVLVWICARAWLDAFGLVGMAAGLTALIGATAWSLGGMTYLYTELWAGMLILASVCLYRFGRPRLGLAAGLVALFYRELSLPYVLVCLGLAVRQRRTWEVRAWAVGLMGYAAFLVYHVVQVRSRLTPLDLAPGLGWVQFGGIRFLLTSTRVNVFLMDLPLWATALYIPLCTLGFTRRDREEDLRVGLAGMAYLLAFAVVGNPFNGYWGFVNAPLMAWGMAAGPGRLAGWFRDARPGRQASQQS